MAPKIPEQVRASLQAAVHTALTLAFMTRGLDVPSEEISDEAEAVCQAVEPFLTRALLNAAALVPGSIPADDVCPLGEHEREVMLLRARGMPRQDQAERLGITVSAINSRLEAAVKKVGADNQMHAYYICVRNGWI